MKKQLKPYCFLGINFLVISVFLVVGLFLEFYKSEFIWLWGFIYVPFILFGGVYLLGLIWGIILQREYNSTWVQIGLLTVIIFVLMLIALLIPSWPSISKNGWCDDLDQKILYTLTPAIRCALMYLVGSTVTKLIQKRRKTNQ